MIRTFLYFLILIALLLPGTHAGAAEAKMDKEYLRRHYPDLYREIFMEGRESGLKEAEAGKEVSRKESEKTPEKNETAARKDAGPADWWNRSSLAQPLSKRILFHGEGSFSGIWLNGNDEGSVYSGSGKVVLRRGRFTDTSIYTIARQKIDQASGGRIRKDYQLAENALQYDLTKRLFAETGIIWETDQASLIGDRVIAFGGLGYYLLDTPRHTLKVYGAYGWQHERYKEIVDELIGVRSEDTGIAYFYQTYEARIFDWLVFRQGFRNILDIEKRGEYVESGAGFTKTGEKNRFRLIFSAEADLKVTDYFSFILKFENRYDSVPWPGVEKSDTLKTVGVKFCF